MAIIPSNIKFVGISPDLDMTERKSARLNSLTEVYTLQDFVDSVGGGDGDLEGNTLVNFVPSLPAGGALSVSGGNQETYKGAVYVVTGAVTIDINDAVSEGFNMSVVQSDANQATFTASGGSLTLRNRQGHTQTAGQYACVTLLRVGNNLILAGDTA
jgi:hypothetical protein